MSDSQFVTALTLATYFNGTTDVAELDPEWIAQANLLLQMISADVEAAAGSSFGAGERVINVPGSWSRDIALNGWDLATITAVELNGTPLAATEYTSNGRAMLRRGQIGFDWPDASDEGFEEDWAALGRQGASWRSGAHWGGPFATVTIHASATVAEIPAVVRSLVLRIAARTFGNVAQITQESLAIYSASYGSSTNTNDGSHVTKLERQRLRKLFGTTAGTIQTGGR